MVERKNDKRTARRFTINREFRSLDEFIREYALNVSLDGCFIRTTELLPKGANVRLRFTVILDELETIEGTGEVVRVIPPGGPEPPGVGVVFTSLTDRSRDVLVRLFLRRQPAKS
jgi:uncharacterized protein (TIGR02266 family)